MNDDNPDQTGGMRRVGMAPALAAADPRPFGQPGSFEIPAVIELQPALRWYDWGDPCFIPTLRGETNAEQRPCAEMWMGAHPDSPSLAGIHGTQRPLDDLIRSAPGELLHPYVSARFDRQLPFLFKVLAAAAPLSLQTHPDKQQAEAGFRRENHGGVSLNDPARNYRDANHKPELVVALTDFYGLRGFRTARELAEQARLVPELGACAPNFDGSEESLRRFYSTVMTWPQERADSVLGPLVERLRQQDQERAFGKNQREYWLLRADRLHCRGGHKDRGLLSFYLLNLVCLHPGEAMFLPAGVLHAYLEGAAVEAMAASNNVLRGGLTTKHIDVPELLRTISFAQEPPEIIRGRRMDASPVWVYSTPAEDFELSRIELNEQASLAGAEDHAVEIFLVERCGSNQPVVVRSGQQQWLARRGQVFLIPARKAYEMKTNGPATLFKVTVPLASEARLNSGAGASSTPSAAPPPLKFRGRAPAALSFGTSGLRGLVTDITDLEAYINTRGFLDYLRQIGDARPGQAVSLAGDLRPSTDSEERSILRAVAQAARDAGFGVDYLGKTPTPALTFHGIQEGRPSIMVTGSHIPFDRNGIKFNKPGGEVLKPDEAGILQAIQRARAEEYQKEPGQSRFGDDGMFKPDQADPLPPVSGEARSRYLARYASFFGRGCLSGLRLVYYQHSGVGRDLMVELLAELGAEVHPRGRSETFVPIDTEDISEDRLRMLQEMADSAAAQAGPIDAVLSTDGDSDRPLLAAVDAGGRARFIGGDLLGIVAAEYLGADTVVTPISANDAVDLWAEKRGLRVIKTRIGSPYVIEAMQRARAGGAKRVAGWEANGGFLTATDFEKSGKVLAALPTRDAALPLLAALCAAREAGAPLFKLLENLPQRRGKAGLIDQFPPETSRALIKQFRPEDPAIVEVAFEAGKTRVRRGDGELAAVGASEAESLNQVRAAIEHWFAAEDGFGRVRRINTLDGARFFFEGGDIAHLRPSGNAPQLRVYAVANTQERADAIVARALQSPGGILRRIEEAMGNAPKPFAEAIRANIAFTKELFSRGETPEVIGTVSGSSAAQKFWQTMLDETRDAFRARAAISFHEDLPTNQAFGILLLWQRLKPYLLETRGALVAFVFGDGTRSTPFTETDNAQKPAIATFVREGRNSRFLSMVELALRYFAPVQQYLRRSGFNGLVVKWGDEIQIPTRDLSGSDPLFHDADVVRFVSMRQMNDDEARNKDWVGVDSEGRVTAFIARRPLTEMELLADRGLVQRREGKLYGGVNLGSIALSAGLLDCLLEEFGPEVNDPAANRKHRPALDPEFFTALTVAALEDPEQRQTAWQQAIRESPDVESLSKRLPDILIRLRQIIQRLEKTQGRKLKMAAMDFGDQYWGDIGQHAKIQEFYMALNGRGPSAEVARALAGLPETRDAQGNLILDSVIAPGVRVRDSVLIQARLTGEGIVQGSVLIGTRAHRIQANESFDVLSTVNDLRLEPGAGAYKIVSQAPIHARTGERLTTLFLPGLGAALFRVLESTDLRDKKNAYDIPILGNPLSFQQAHEQMGSVPAEALQLQRAEAQNAVLEGKD